MTMPPSVSLICLRTLVRLTYRNSSGLLAPSPESTWPRTRPLGSPRVLPLSAFTAGRMLRVPLQGCLALATTILSSMSSGPSLQRINKTSAACCCCPDPQGQKASSKQTPNT
ncbi:eukaryotic translation initiation factor 3, subunit 4 (delta), isoform CRA_b, partial [Rattus norvegicus]